mgnify:CR=1 FL=1
MIPGEIKADSGDIARQQQLVTAKLEQDVPKDISGSIYEVISGGLGDIAYRYISLINIKGISGYKFR